MKNNLPVERLFIYACVAAGLCLVSAKRVNGASPYSAAVQGDGAVAYYRFNDSLLRTNINVNSGSAGAAANATNTFNVHAFPGAIVGSSDRSQFFDTGASYSMIPYNAAINPDNTKPFTVEAWFYPASDQINGGQCPLNNRLAGSAPNRSGWVFFQRAPDDSYAGKPGNEGIGWNFRMYRGSGSSSGLDVVSGVPYQIGKWTHVAVVYDPIDPVTNASLTIYINGVAANTNLWIGGASGTDPGYVANATDSDVALSFGAYNNTSGAGNNPYFGAIDEFAFYQAKLDPAQILTHYQNGTNASRSTAYDSLIKSANPAVYLRLSEPSPGADVAINMGDLFASGNALFTPAVKHPGTTALAGRTDDGSFSGAWRNGGGTRASVPWTAGNNPDAGVPFTFEAWFRPLNDRLSPGPCPVNNRYVASGNRTGWVIYQRSPNDTYAGASGGGDGVGWNFRMYTGSGSSSQNIVTSVPYKIAEWQHLVVTWQPQTDLGASTGGSEQWQGILTAYVDGIAVATNGDINTPGTGAIYAANINPPESGNAADLTIGSYNAASNFGEEFEGDIDEVAFYNNYVLSADQIFAHYQAGTNSHPATNYETLVLTAAYNPSAPQRTMPKSYFRFNEPAYFPAANSGASGSPADGVLVLATNSSAGPTTSGFESTNTAVALNGTNNWIALNDPSALDLSGQITMEAWINPSATQGDPARVVSHGPMTPSNFDTSVVATNAVAGSNEVFLRMEGGGATYAVGTSDGLAFHGATAAVPAGDLGGSNGWIYLVGTYDGANWRLFRNGVQIASVADAVGALPVPGAEWAIGATGEGWGNFFSGSVDEVSIYDKALTAAQIQAHYAAANSGGSPSPSLVIEKSGSDYVIKYSGGTLQQSDSVAGSYSAVPNASSPYTVPPGTAVQFYRLKL